MLFATLFGASILAAMHITNTSTIQDGQLVAIGLPTLTLSAWSLYSARRILRLEEFERAIAINSFASASAIVFWLGTVWGLGALFAGFPTPPIVFIAPLATAIWQIVWLILNRRFT